MHASHPYIKDGKQYAFTRCNAVISFELLPRADLIPLNMPNVPSSQNRDPMK